MTVRGLRGATLLGDGRRVIESEGIGKRRSEQVAMLLAGLGVEVEVGVEYSTSPEPADGIDDWMSRRVDVLVAP